MWGPITLGLGVYHYPKLFSAEGRKSIKQYLSDTLPQLLVWLGLIALGNLGHVDHDEFFDETKDFDVPRDDDVIVVVNAGTGKDRALIDRTIKRHFGKNPRVIVLHPANYEEMVAGLEKARRDFGPITKLNVLGHGGPGSFDIANAGDNVARDSAHPDLMAKDAKVRLIACLTGSGERGDAFLETFADKFLLRGGEIAASRVLVMGSPSDGISVESGWDVPEGLAYESTNLAVKAVQTPVRVMAPIFAGIDSKVAWNEMFAWNQIKRVKRKAQ